jgi:Flp pilus assembly protein TadG
MTPATRSFLAPWSALWRDRRGGYSTMAALLMPVLAGFTALGTETGLWFYAHQTMQGAADGAAFSGATAYSQGGTTTYSGEAQAVAAKYGFVQGANGTTVTVNHPPTAGAYTTNANAVEVIVQQTQKRLFSAVIMANDVNIVARAVATSTPSNSTCVLGLDTSAANTVQLLNNAALPDPNCGVASNSSSATAVSLSNNATLAGAVTSHGGIFTSNNSFATNPSQQSNAPVTPDPYAAANAGTPPACTSQNGAGANNGSRSLSPDTFVGGVGMARFCAGLNFSNNFNVTFAPGVYFIDSQLVFGNNATITGTDVTLVINGNYAITINNNAHVTLSAPTTGPTAGIAFFGNRTGTSTVTQRFANNTVLNLTGALYFPNQILELDNNTSSLPNHGCTQVIGRMVRFMNNVDLGANCAGTGVKQIGSGGGGIVSLVE